MKMSENNECFLKETIEIQARTLPVQKKVLQKYKVASFTEEAAALKKKESRSDYFQEVRRNSMRVSRQSQKG